MNALDHLVLKKPKIDFIYQFSWCFQVQMGWAYPESDLQYWASICLRKIHLKFAISVRGEALITTLI